MCCRLYLLGFLWCLHNDEIAYQWVSQNVFLLLSDIWLYKKMKLWVRATLRRAFLAFLGANLMYTGRWLLMTENGVVCCEVDATRARILPSCFAEVSHQWSLSRVHLPCLLIIVTVMICTGSQWGLTGFCHYMADYAYMNSRVVEDQAVMPFWPHWIWEVCAYVGSSWANRKVPLYILAQGEYLEPTASLFGPLPTR